MKNLIKGTFPTKSELEKKLGLDKNTGSIEGKLKIEIINIDPLFSGSLTLSPFDSSKPH